ncbi:MAG: Isomerase [Caulobacteraceae bacterium]|nr:Isomerase [Caulobacteraceae bacterium]
MKIGFNMFLWTGRVSEEHYPILRDLKQTGYHGVEIPVLEGEAGEYRELAGVLEDMGLERTSVGAIFDPALDPLSPDRGVRDAALEAGIRLLDRVHAVGASILAGPMYQVLGQFTGTAPTEDEFDRGCDFHRRMGEAASERGVVIALEPLNRFEAYFITTAHQASAYADRVGHPNVRIMYDTFHANIEETDPVGVFAPTVSSTVHVHISENDRGVPGRGHIPWAATFKAIRSSGYDGWLTIEAFGRTLPTMAAATKIWRDLSDTPEQVYREGYQTIVRGWEAAG